MSSKFSRRRTRVQQPPKVCKSKRRPPTTSGATFAVTWNLNTPFPVATSTKNTTFNLPTPTTAPITINTTDDQGRATVITIRVGQASIDDVQIAITGFGPSGNDAFSQLSSHPITPPYTWHWVTWFFGVLVSGTADATLTI